MEGIVSTSRKYLSVQNGVMVERINGEENVRNAIWPVYLMHAEIKKVFKGPEGARQHVGDQLHLHFITENDYYVLCMWENSRPAKAFYNMMLNIRLNEAMMVITKMDEFNGKKRESLMIRQNGYGIKWNHTKDNPNGLPQMVQGADGKWNDEDQMVFFLDCFEKDFLPKLKKVSNPFPFHPVYSQGMFDQRPAESVPPLNTQSNQGIQNSGDVDDLPF